MGKYKIPSEVYPGFKELSLLDAKNVNAFLKAIKEFTPGSSLESFNSLIPTSSQVDNYDKISEVIFSFGSLLASTKDEEDTIIKDLVVSFESFEDESSELKSKTLKKLEKNLKKIFEEKDKLKLHYKTSLLIIENDKVYIDSKIISDIRLVFNKALDQSSRYAAIIHRLKLNIYTDNAENKRTHFISLDSKDLLDLKKQIERALEKEKIIKNDYKDSINFIELSS